MNSTEFYAIHLYRNAFVQLRMGKASAMAWILFLIIIVFTIILFRTSARWFIMEVKNEFSRTRGPRQHGR